MQWGVYTFSEAVPNGTLAEVVTFDRPFNQLIAFIPYIVDGRGVSQYLTAHAYGVSATKCGIILSNRSTTAIENVYVHWLAIGK